MTIVKELTDDTATGTMSTRLVNLVNAIRGELPELATSRATELAHVIDRLILALGPERVYVFGSQARADARPDSDIDLLVVVPDTSASPYQLVQLAYGAAHLRSLDVDILVMPHEEFAWRSRARASLPATVLREGRLLYDVA